ncbi:hypothetical protein R5H30_19485 [Sulfitobacter sp. D35]|uniref:hypothetical protein n=1 Tax=Sulfitobacter sp. D35 TaxID=3083252 RepID=UPI00296FBEC0|nr:hypothetical protein [Sulfitobacter sp. D35]MDW4500179.1 hypothetical protein [Sulfitobacter sp. D35]
MTEARNYSRLIPLFLLLTFSAGHPAQPSEAGRATFVELRISACRDDECRDFSLLFDPFEVSVMTCMMSAQQQAALWSASHPGWNITRFTCSMHGADGLEA